jgi:predicted house-cleaning noncanonical NTP pyrophosphatase (MazG superfamily)
MKKIFYNKLIRDKIPERIEESGGEYLVKKLNNQSFLKELIKKVGEESDGLVKAKTKKEIIDEMGDVFDVLDEIKKTLKIKSSELLVSRKNAFKKKGGFKKRLFLVWSSDTGYKSNERKYKNKK